ncbi:CAMK protein kinase [Cladophialophora psammophila CBS 110553]|uniref:CAMK protein kinase n=1 Tax=Cladophialophora psammophila CBS 110553 TaxID=1182543 RepID=W9WTU3_9EURO|nr:CAMK protein kinase [Cladophialophora psammophila CBS 110553]EXJ68440.1 CAMK protein kinase [Cladophialophora psammophila CBS 110553]
MDVATDIVHALEICTRLNEWTRKPTNSPVISLLQQHVAKLSAQVQCLGKQFSHPTFPSDAHSLDEVAKILHSVKNLLFQAFTLLDICSTVEKDGDEGALNALFASLFVNDTKVDLGEVRYITDRIHQSGQECHKILSRWFGPEATARNWSWGTSPKPPTDVFEELIPELTSLLERDLSRFSPRYVHTYNTTRDVPYIVDSSAPPTSGSCGIVRKVVHRQTQESFAQKTFQNIFSAADRKNVLKELGVLELCFHRNIIQLIGAYDVNEEPYSIHIVMTPWAPYTLLEFLCGEDADRKAKCPWFEQHSVTSDTCIYRMMYEVADAVRYLHRLSIKHKDIKPDNILLHREQQTGRCIPIITDVGISKVFRRGADTDYDKGSYQYLSPEQLKHKESSLKADIWQLGCCFAMLLTVARGGTSAMDKLWTAFQKTVDRRACNIAIEYNHFMETFRGICIPGDASQEHAHSVTCRMLEMDPLVRIDIEAVRTEMERLPHD